MVRRLLVVISAMFLTMPVAVTYGPAAPVADAQDQSAIMERVKDSLVFVRTDWTGYLRVPGDVTESGEGFWSDPIKLETSCSGFVVSPSGHIVTAGHCLDPQDPALIAHFRTTWIEEKVDAEEITPARGEELIDQANQQQWVVEGKGRDSDPDRTVEVIQPDDPDRVITDWATARVIDFEPETDGDHALVKVSGFDTLPPLVIAQDRPTMGHQLTAVGFPVRDDGEIDPSRVPQPSFKTGTVAGYQVLTGGIAGTEIDADVVYGMSGGPTVSNSTGEVLGVNLTGFGNDDTSFITDASTLRSFLQRNGVTLAAPAPSKPFPWIWVAATIVGVLMVLAAVLVLVLRRSKPGAGPPPPPPARPSTHTPQPPWGPTQTPPQQQPWSPTLPWQPQQPG